MVRVRYRKCTQCGEPNTPQSPISSRGLCRACGLDNWAVSIEQIAQGVGPIANKYNRKRISGTLRYLETLTEQLSESDKTQH